MYKEFIRLSVALGLYLMAGDCFAGVPETRMSVTDIPAGTVGLGAAIRGGTSPYTGVNNIASQGAGNKVDLLPLYLYEGEWLFAHGTSAGIHAFDNDWLKVDVLAKYRFNRLESDANDYFEGLRDRNQTVDAGVSFTLNGDWGHCRPHGSMTFWATIMAMNGTSHTSTPGNLAGGLCRHLSVISIRIETLQTTTTALRLAKHGQTARSTNPALPVSGVAV